MKTIVLAIMLTIGATAHSLAAGFFHEDFEYPSYCDSMSATCLPQPPSGMWQVTSLFAAQGIVSNLCQVQAGKMIYLTTLPFSTVGYSLIFLKFSQICKVDFLDIASLEYSTDNGINWTLIPGSCYQGNGIYQANGNRFCSNSYPDWSPSDLSAIPTNAWWKEESFNLSNVLSNCPQAIIRFKLADGGNPGPNSNYGWLLDQIRITGVQGFIDGIVSYDNTYQTPMTNTTVYLLVDGNYTDTCLTNSNGAFSFEIDGTGNCLLLVTTAKPWGGVNSIDALAVLNHFTGMSTLTDLKLMAADVNGNGNINSLDALILTKRFLGLTSGFAVGDWIFASPSIAGPVTGNNFITVKGLCFGDLNGSYVPPL